MSSITVEARIADEVFGSTGFSYDISESENTDGTVTLVFDSPDDARKFQAIAADLSRELAGGSMLSFAKKCEMVQNSKALMDSSKMVCLDDAVRLFQTGREELANARLEKAAQYAWGFSRPPGWVA